MDRQLLKKYISGDATEKEAQLVIEWIGQSEENRREYIAQRKLFDISIWRKPVKITSMDMKKKGRRRKIPLSVLQIAALFTLIMAGATLWIVMKGDSKAGQLQCVYSPTGKQAEILLSDGTKVWLNTQSRLTFPSSFKGKYRKVKLEGEGFFIVSPDKKKPFIVETNRYNIKVLGTEFNVIAYDSDKEWQTALLKGSVEICSPGGKTAMKLEPHTMVRSEKGGLIKQAVIDDEYYKWREGIISFDNVSVEEIINKLELYYGISIIVKEDQFLSERYTGKFQLSDGIDHLLNVLKMDKKFSYHWDEKNRIIIDNE